MTKKTYSTPVLLHKRSFNFTPEQLEALEEVRKKLSLRLGIALSSTDALHLCVKEVLAVPDRKWRGKADQDGD